MVHVIREFTNSHTRRSFIFSVGNKNKVGFKFYVAVTQEKDIPPSELSDIDRGLGFTTYSDLIIDRYFDDFFSADEFYDSVLLTY